MKITLWGTRGSLPTPGPDTLRYGGNTSCVEVEGDDGTRLVLDAGTGIRRLGAKLCGGDAPVAGRRSGDTAGHKARGATPWQMEGHGQGDDQRNGRPHGHQIHVLLTHLHMDHIQGLGFFQPLDQAGRDVHLWGPPSTTQDLRARLSRYLSPPLFPVRLNDLGSRLTLHEAPLDGFEIGGLRIQASLVCHPGPTVGYRISEGGKTFTYIPDHEPALGSGDIPRDREWISGFDLAQGADLLIHDCQYSLAEYPRRAGWGHSALSHALAFSERAGVAHFVTFHHDPAHDDARLDRMLAEARERAEVRMPVSPGIEGAEFSL